MLDVTVLKDIRPFIATPSYGGAMSSIYVQSLLGLVNLAWSHGFAMHTRFLDGDSLIPRARNRLAAEFLADARWTHLFWIDADIGFAPEAALRLLLAGRDVVAGVYPLKNEGWPSKGLRTPLPAGSTRAHFEARHAKFPANALAGERVADADGFIEVLDAPTGFMLIARRVLEHMAQALPELRYTPDASEDAPDWPHYRFFDLMVEAGTGRYLSEDYAFCRRWQLLGGQVFVDAQSNLAHQGLRTYTGDFGQALAARGRESQP